MLIMDLLAQFFVCYLAYRGWLKLREWFNRKDEILGLGRGKLSEFIQEEIRRGVQEELERQKNNNKK